MNFCTMCKLTKEDSAFNPTASQRQIVVCLECATKAKESFYRRIKSGETMKDKIPIKKCVRKAPIKPDGAVAKRCPFCRAPLWVTQTDLEMSCWKCGTDFKIVQALRDNTTHRHGVILSVIN